MSIFSKIARGIVGVATGFATGGPLGGLVGGLTSLAPQPRAATPASFAPAAVQGFATQVRGVRLPTIPRFPGKPPGGPGLPIPFPGPGNGAAPGQDLGFGGAGACPVGFHLDKKTRTRCVRNRRMNVLNGRAAMRAIRRVKGARKMLQKIERQLPKSKTRRTPAHGHRVHVHTP